MRFTDLFGIRGDLALLRRAERGEADADDLAHADWTLEARLAAALARVDLAIAPDTPLASLSGGQRTRAALAALIFAQPDFLLLDEPTNDLDRKGWDAVAALLADWRGGALVVSHDRALLESMDTIVEVTAAGISRYGGGWSVFREQKDLNSRPLSTTLPMPRSSWPPPLVRHRLLPSARFARTELVRAPPPRATRPASCSARRRTAARRPAASRLVC